jgi:hypothetical protein
MFARYLITFLATDRTAALTAGNKNERRRSAIKLSAARLSHRDVLIAICRMCLRSGLDRGLSVAFRLISRFLGFDRLLQYRRFRRAGLFPGVDLGQVGSSAIN